MGDLAAGTGGASGTEGAAASDLAPRIAAVRRFNRFYTRQIGLLGGRYLRSPFSLTEARVLYELAQGQVTTASELCKTIGLDAGYLSRILRGFERQGLIEKRPSAADARQSLVSLTAPGREAFARLNARSSEEIGAMLGRLSTAQQVRLVQAMETVAALLGERPQAGTPYILRPHRPGDMGWVVQRHGLLYAQEYGFDERFEALVAGIVAAFIQQYDPRRERCWIAERDGVPVGSVFLVRESETEARLRLLLVEPHARGLGIGRRLVQECLDFARAAGYRKVILWTQSILLAARHLYAQAGFRLVHQGPHHSFGRDLVEETWELALDAPPREGQLHATQARTVSSSSA
ncbi:MAG TPA: helix-turn-helix domain-containing GNAT family N-acetyltransferase [Chloroflexota bacterium]|jgi:DNA-binding MarR family transcriptional regulator/GNAT superfamily N-acetyltransferase|nr:helix-turn-helix domain-containing GNAT family N-acetyltransferase [Chloroflexota bacterium]